MIKEAKKRSGSPRPVMVSTLAAKLLGHSRAAGAATFSVQQLNLAFPGFNELEMTFALEELLDKKLMLQKGAAAKETYVLTDLGREGRVGVA